MLNLNLQWKIKKTKIEDFKTAISSTVRSLSELSKYSSFFGNQVSKSENNSIRLPNLEKNRGNKINYEEIRAIADSKSLNRFSNKKTFKKYEPSGKHFKKIYSISEKIRCEKIGTSYFKGVKNNIEKYYQ